MTSPVPMSVAVVIPAKDEAERIAPTVTAAAGLPHVDLVIVVDDGSGDATARLAEAAGARVVRHESNHGKAAAMMTGAKYAAAHDDPLAPRAVLFVDADLGASAANLAALIGPVLAGEADLTVANIPRANSSGGGGRVVRLAQRTVAARTGRQFAQPLNGMRCITRPALASALPLASGWGVEVGMLLDVLAAGHRVVEVPVEFTHRATGTDLAGVLHRGKQMRDVARVAAGRRGRAGGRGNVAGMGGADAAGGAEHDAGGDNQGGGGDDQRAAGGDNQGGGGDNRGAGDNQGGSGDDQRAAGRGD